MHPLIYEPLHLIPSMYTHVKLGQGLHLFFVLSLTDFAFSLTWWNTKPMRFLTISPYLMKTIQYVWGFFNLICKTKNVITEFNCFLKKLIEFITMCSLNKQSIDCIEK